MTKSFDIRWPFRVKVYKAGQQIGSTSGVPCKTADEALDLALSYAGRGFDATIDNLLTA